jgi:hypothetical protein
MRPWMIVLSSAIGAIFAAVAMAIPEVVNAPRGDIAPILLSRWPALVVAALAVYGLCAIVLTTTTLVTGILRLRYHLARTAADAVSARREVGAAFVSGLRWLAPRLAAALAQSTDADGGVAFDVRLTVSDIRGEMARLYYVSVARSHFISALVILAGIAALGLAHDRASLPLEPGAIPTASAVIIITGLILLGVLGRIAVDVTAEPLLDSVCQLPIERVEIGLLRRAVELLELACDRSLANETTPEAQAQIPERLVAAIEQGHDALFDAVNRLSTNVEALEAAMRTSVEAIETIIHTASAQQGRMDGDKLAGAAGLSELRTAVERLTVVLQRLSAVPEGSEEPIPATEGEGVPPPRPGAAPRLARELRQLLQEIDAGR